MKTRSMKDLSGGIEPDLESARPDLFEKLPSELEVAPGFEEPEGDVFCRSHTVWESFPKETASLDELKEGIGDLQEKVEDLAGYFVVAVDVLQRKSPVLLDIEALIFHLPSDSSSLIGYRDGPCRTDFYVGHPLESGGFHLPLFIGLGLEALVNGQNMLPILGVDIDDPVHPPVFLVDLAPRAGSVHQVIVGLELLESLELLLDGGEVVFVNDHVLPSVPVAQLEDGSHGKEAVKTQTDGKAGESFLEPFRQSVEGLGLAVLLGGVFSRILNELRHEGEGEPFGCDQLCLEHLVIVGGLRSVGLGEAMGAVPFIEGQGAGPIDGHDIVDAEKPRRIEHLLSNEGLGHTGDDFLSLDGTERGEEVVESIAVGEGLHIEEELELLAGWLVVSKQVSDLSPCSQPEQEHENPCKAKGGETVGDLLRTSWICHALEDLLEATEEMLDRLYQNPDQSLLLLLIFINGGFTAQGSRCKIFFHCSLLDSTTFRLSAKNPEGSIGGKLSLPLILSRSAARKKITLHCCY